MQTFTSGQIAHLAGVSLRQLQWWDERDVVNPQHIGHSRQYTERQVVEILAIAELRRKAVSLQVVRRVLHTMKRKIRDAESLEGVYILMTEKHIQFVHDPDELVLRMAEEPGYAAVVNIGKAFRIVREYQKKGIKNGPATTRIANFRAARPSSSRARVITRSTAATYPGDTPVSTAAGA